MSDHQLSSLESRVSNPDVIVALDVADAPAAVELLDRLPPKCPVKIGSVLMTRTGSGFVRGLIDAGHPVFLDLKWHDIPNTVRGAVEAAVDLGVEMATVHALGGEAMMTAAAKASAGRVALVAVTVLTSHDAAAFAAIMGRPVADTGAEVVRLATMAMSSGMQGIVCSAAELAVVKPIVGAGRLVVPGIRRAGDAVGDQQRIATPATARAAGATHLVIGRPIIEAADPVAAWHAMIEGG